MEMGRSQRDGGGCQRREGRWEWNKADLEMMLGGVSCRCSKDGIVECSGKEKVLEIDS
jgi:hypothetical protein